MQNRDASIVFDAENLTVGLYADRWLDSIRASVRESTYERYENLTSLHIVPVLGNVKLNRLNALQVQALYRAKLDDALK